MDKEIEEKFVNKFVEKDKRKRIFFELCSAKKREWAIQKLLSVLNNQYLVLQDNKITDEELLALIKRYFDTNKNCYVIARSVDDGKILPFKLAFSRMIEDCENYVLICGDDLVVAKEEFYMHNTTKIILHRQ